MSNGPQPDEPGREPTIIGAESMPASLGSIQALCREITLFLIDCKHENKVTKREVEITQNQTDVLNKFPDLVKVAAIESEHSQLNEGMMHLFLHYPKYTIEYHIRRYHRSGLMDIEKVINLPADPEQEKKPMSYEERAAKMLSKIQAGMLEEDTGIKSVSLKETRDLTWLVSRLNT